MRETQPLAPGPGNREEVWVAMYILVRLHVDYGRRVRWAVHHLRPDDAGVPELLETLEEHALPPEEGPKLRECGWVVPANPHAGDILEFELTEVSPIGPDGAGYSWEASLCEANGPGRIPEPLLFRVVVPEQTADDIADCTGSEVTEGRGVKDGPRSFRWTVADAA